MSLGCSRVEVVNKCRKNAEIVSGTHSQPWGAQPSPHVLNLAVDVTSGRHVLDQPLGFTRKIYVNELFLTSFNV